MAALKALEQKLLDLIEKMESEGIVDSIFRECYKLKEVDGVFYFIEMVPTYMSESKDTLREMTSLLEEPIVDYYKLEQLCLKLKGGTSCLGAHQMATSCGEFRRAVIAKSKDDCIKKLDAIKCDFHILIERLDTFLELETRIVTNDYQGA